MRNTRPSMPCVAELAFPRSRKLSDRRTPSATSATAPSVCAHCRIVFAREDWADDVGVLPPEEDELESEERPRDEGIAPVGSLPPHTQRTRCRPFCPSRCAPQTDGLLHIMHERDRDGCAARIWLIPPAVEPPARRGARYLET